MISILCRSGMWILSFIFILSTAQAQTAITPATALHYYLNNGDSAFHWGIRESYNIGDVMVYGVLLTSQKWREHTWTHQLSIMIPKQLTYDGALLFITGGSINKKGYPNWSGKEDELIKPFSEIAQRNSAAQQRCCGSFKTDTEPASL